MTTLNTLILFSFKTWKMCLPNVFQFGVALLTKLEATIKIGSLEDNVFRGATTSGFPLPFF